MFDSQSLGLMWGATDYLVKPVTREQLNALLRRIQFRSPSALLIENDPNARELLKDMLEREGWMVSEASNGREGLKKLEEVKPALIVVNAIAPGMDSFTFNDVVQQNPKWSRIPIIVLTEKDEMSLTIDKLNDQLHWALKERSSNADQFVSRVRSLLPSDLRRI
jgi:DNA-binding response OmpR family regulator